ncbi:MAG: aminoglycoside resistance protein [Anaerolineales bacterium]|nr:aminoglycoside resistance protein [Chloroflexota bacterium]MBL6981168.1 aminoglycoside resistance protein [Anaerolineales bacterium]
MLLLPKRFQQNIAGAFGTQGKIWLEKFPSTLNDYTQRWSLELLPHFGPLSYNFVAPVIRQDGSDAVLKLGVPNPELTSEILALWVYDGHGAVRLLKADPEGGAMLLEHVNPGTPLAEIDDDAKNTEIAAQVMLQLWESSLNLESLEDRQGFRTVEGWAKGIVRLREHYYGGTGPFPEKLVEQAETLFAELLSSTDLIVVLHGDLHHWNILRAQRQPWLALDPKGVVGDPAFEVAAWMHNPIDVIYHWDDLDKILARRLDQFSEILGIDRQRLLGWSLAQSVLSAWWCIEDNSDCFDKAITTAKVLSRMQGNQR